jgi:ubiquitin-like modifier-activating enzyme ATG7
LQPGRSLLMGICFHRQTPPFESVDETMTIVQFAPFTSLVQPAFWHDLSRFKIDVLRLSQSAVPITATYGAGRNIADRETSTEVALPCNLTVAGDAFGEKGTVK